MSKPAPTRIGFIGSGFARRVQLPALAFVPDAKAVAIASGHVANAESVAREFGIARVYDDGEELARSDDVDLVIVSSTPDTHARYAIAALEAGKHVLCEKPMAIDADEASQMVATSAQHPDRIAWIDHELRYEPNRRRAHELIRSDAIGELRHIELSLKPYLRGDGRPQTSDAPWNWWFDASRGGGILGAVGSHLIDLCRFWSGSEITYVAGLAETFIRQRKDAAGKVRPVTADDFASCVLRSASGAVATITLSTVAHHGDGHMGQVTGSDGTLRLTGETKLELGKAGGPLEDISAPDDLTATMRPNNMWARSFVRLLRDMVRVIGGGLAEGEPATFHDGLQVQRVLDAVRAGQGAGAGAGARARAGAGARGVQLD
ncbi:MAG TPA: Gfo/Idh/MocA family oxidoreductase [Gemmatimonadales bacterium]|nr:Gfo/Idh/MocA family oxidoreductase [Gemmatimonadales bacterium]